MGQTTTLSNEDSSILDLFQPFNLAGDPVVKLVVKNIKSHLGLNIEDYLIINNIDFSNENLDTLRSILRLNLINSDRNNIVRFGFYFGTNVYAIPEDRLIFSKAADGNTNNKVSLFEYVGSFNNKPRGNGARRIGKLFQY